MKDLIMIEDNGRKDMNNDQVMKEILLSAKTIASVGLSANPERDSNEVSAYLREHGYRVIPVNPTIKEVFGEKAYPDLPSVPEKVDVVQVFRKSEDVPPIVEDAIKIGARVVWMQEGIINEEAAAKARAAGLQVIMDTCMKKNHRRLIGDQPLPN
jgi:predicted CoA-binding protein